LFILSSVILCVTGAEALYADMGHFGAKPIRVAWGILVGPSLVLCYLGQAALVARDPDAVESPFFALAPEGPGVLILVVMATAATVIASQALITGVFSLTRQATSLGVFPRIRVLQTNAEHSGQIYVPTVNWAVGAVTIALVVMFKTSSALADAYVLAIAGTMSITTVAFHVVARRKWNWSRRRMIPLTSLFLLVDLGFLLGTAGNLFKGGWVPVAMGAVVLVVMLIWRKGFMALNAYMRDHTMEWEYLEDELEHGSVTRVPGIGVYLASPREKVPAALASQARILHSIPAEAYVVTVETGTVPFLENKVEKITLLPRITKVIIRVGYMQTPDVPKVLHDHFLLERERVATYYISERHFLATDQNLVSRWPERAFEVLHRNEAPIATYFNLPGDRLISLGTRIDL
jgi:KUP system potassium uptake protein